MSTEYDLENIGNNVELQLKNEKPENLGELVVRGRVQKEVRDRFELLSTLLENLENKREEDKFEDIVRFVHRIAALDLDARNPGKNATRYLAGSTRGPSMVVGNREFVFPFGDTHTKLYKDFCNIMPDLLCQCKTLEDYKTLAVYSYLNLIVIHPFPDANGRTFRLIAELIYYRGLRKFQPGLMRIKLPEFPSKINNRDSDRLKLVEIIFKFIESYPLLDGKASSFDEIKNSWLNNFQRLWKNNYSISSISRLNVIKELKALFK